MRRPGSKHEQGRAAEPPPSARRREIEEMFPPALIACVGEARGPRPNDIAILREKLWAEGFSRSDVDRRTAEAMARAALGGCGDSGKDELPRSLAAIYKLWVARERAFLMDDTEQDRRSYRLSLSQDGSGEPDNVEFQARNIAAALARARELLPDGASASLLQDGRLVARLSCSREGVWTTSGDAPVRC